MDLPMNRRRWLRALGGSGAATSLGAMNVNLEAAQRRPSRAGSKAPLSPNM